jgi:uncharacterized protein
MPTATFRFYDDLNFFLPRRHKDQAIQHEFDWKASIKDMIESLGVPHAEIELIVVNGASVDFEAIVQPDDQIEVYPFAAPVDLHPKVALRPPYPGRPAFILDQHLGRLAAYLRMMGFDTRYRNDYHDEELAQVSHDETRILLTRDIGLLKRSLVIYGYYVRETHRQKQLAEITRRFTLRPLIEPFRRCMKCNGVVHEVDKAEVEDGLPHGTASYYQDFHRCDSCGRVFWKGTHHERMQALLDEIIRQS